MKQSMKSTLGTLGLWRNARRYLSVVFVVSVCTVNVVTAESSPVAMGASEIVVDVESGNYAYATNDNFVEVEAFTSGDTAEVGSEPTEMTLLVVDGESDNAIAAATSRTWQFWGYEKCWDLWSAPCTVNFPQPQCPANPAGKACSGFFCWHTISSSTVEAYSCS